MITNIANLGLNPLRGSLHIRFITTGFTRGYYCLIRQPADKKMSVRH